MISELYINLLVFGILRRRMAQLGLLIIILFVLSWFYNHTFITITIDNRDKNSELTFSLVQQNNQKTTSFKASSSKVRRFVQRGSYEVMVRGNDSSYFSVIKTGGFLTTTTTHGSLSPENSRSFVGDNPAFCMFYTGQLLFSYSCQGQFSQAQVHVAATDSQPTYVLNSSTAGHDAGSTIEGMFKTSSGTFTLLHTTLANPITGISHVVYSLNDDLSLGQNKVLPDLDPNQNYTAQSYKDGFVVYNASLSQVFYYTSIDAKPTPITVGKAIGGGLIPLVQNVGNDSFVVEYTKNPDPTESNSAGATNSKTPSQVVIYTSGVSKQFKFNKQYSAIALCGDNRLCLLDNKTLEIYDISSNSPKLLFIITNVESIQDSRRGLLVARNKEILELNTNTRSGFSSYSLGNYSYCGIQNDPSGYILCLINSKQKKVALHIDQQTTNSDNIDKKIDSLTQYVEVNNISIYKNYIYVSPNYGGLVYNSSINSYTPDPAILKQVDGRINQAIDKLSIDRSKYTVVNPFE